jgi:hypothetical protein
MAPPAPFKQVTRPDPREDTTKRIENAQLEHGCHAALKSRNQVIFRDSSAARHLFQQRAWRGSFPQRRRGCCCRKVSTRRSFFSTAIYHRKMAVLTS